MKRKNLFSRTGLSMLELLVAMVMITILMVSAFMSWGSYVDDARRVSTLNRMDVIRKALEAWSADHLKSYPTNDLRPLQGRYLSAEEGDGWGNDFVIDKYFMRVISRGANGVLNTPVPGIDERAFDVQDPSPSPDDALPGEVWVLDDLVSAAKETGRLVLQGNNDSIWVLRPEGGALIPIANAGDGIGGDLAPGGGAVVWGDGTDYDRDWMTESDSIGDYDTVGDVLRDSVAMHWITTPFPAGGWGTAVIAPDGIHIAALRDNGAGTDLVVGEVVAPEEGQGAPAYLVSTIPGTQITNGSLGHLAWDRRGSSLYFDGSLGAESRILKVGSAPGSLVSTPVWGVEGGQDTTSIDVCVTRDRFVVVRDNQAVVLGATGRPIKSAPAPLAGSVTRAAINRQGDAVAVIDGGQNLWIWWPDRPDAAGNPLAAGNPHLVMDGGPLASATGGVRILRWR